jgi:hypothetical protein
MTIRHSLFHRLALASGVFLSSTITLNPISLASTPYFLNTDVSGGARSQVPAIPPAATPRAWLPIILGGGDSAPPGSGPTIGDVKVLTAGIARYEKFEVQFEVNTRATNLDLPFDPNPPPGLQAAAGISVDAEFSPDNWTTVIRQPAFRYQPYTHTVLGNQDHFTPSGPPSWMVRFAPQQAGTWQFRLVAQDASGTSVYPSDRALAFTVGPASSNPYTRRGFLRVSAADPRYFEFQDSTPFVGVGFNDGFDSTSDAEQKAQRYEQYKMDFMRVWLSGAGINGSQWTAWASHHLSDDGYLPGVLFDTQNTYDGGDETGRQQPLFLRRLPAGKHPCRAECDLSCRGPRQGGWYRRAGRRRGLRFCRQAGRLAGYRLC